jgi:hypothetical protein
MHSPVSKQPEQDKDINKKEFSLFHPSILVGHKMKREKWKRYVAEILEISSFLISSPSSFS